MRIGVFAPPWGPTAMPDDFAKVAATAEAAGYLGLWVGDHVVFPREVGSTYLYNESGVSPFDPAQPLLDPVTLLAWLAGKTGTIELGMSVLVVAMRNPVETAKQLADLAILSGDRLVLGVGVGWMREEFAALGADYEHRGEITDEWIAIFRHLWEGRVGPFEGKHYRFDPLGFEPRPQRLPVIVGGNSDAAMRRAARNDGWHPIRMSPERLGGRVERLGEILASDGREADGFEIIYRGPVMSKDHQEAGPGLATGQLAESVGSLLEQYEDAGATQFIVEWSDAPTPLRVSWMEWLADSVPLRLPDRSG